MMVHNYCTPCDTNTTAVNTTKVDDIAGMSNGSVTVAVTGGSGPYTHSWNTGATTASINNLPGGSYSDTIKDRNGCILIEEVYICSPALMTLAHSLVQLNCSTQRSNVTTTVTGGVGPYTHWWSNNNTSDYITYAPFGTYYHTVTDSRGCSKKDTIIISCTPPCQTNCTFQGTISGLTTPGSNTNIQCGDTYNVECNKNYQGGVSLNCITPPPAPPATLLSGTFKNQLGQIVTPLWNNGYFNFPNAGIYTATYYKTNAGGNCDSCIITFNVTCDCPSTCTVSSSINPVTGSSLTLSATATELECDKAYNFPPATLTCVPVSTAMIITPVKIIDAFGNTPSWAAGFSGTGLLNIPAGTTGSFFVKYFWGTATKRCDSVSYPINITCCSFTAQAGSDIYICKGASANLGAAVSGLTYSWTSNPAGFTSTIANPTVTPTVFPTTYYLSVTNANPNCPAKKDTVVVYEDPNCTVDCCKGNFWKEPITIRDNATGDVLETWVCKKLSTYSITKANYSCGKDLIVSGQFVCGNKNTCPSKVIYTLTNSNGAVTTGTNSIQLPISLPDGNYTLKYEAYCGDSICDSCKFEIVKNCSVVCDCEKAACSFKTYYLGAATANKKPFKCDENLQLECNKTYGFVMATSCISNCSSTVTAELINASGIPVQTQTNISATNPFNVIFSTPGRNTYTIRFHLLVNGVECNKCDVNISVKCPASTCNACTAAITASTTTNTDTHSTPGLTEVFQSFSFSGLPASITEIRAVVTSIDIYAEDAKGVKNEECLSCNNDPIAWGSIFKGNTISNIVPTLNVAGAEVYGPITNQSINPRQITWAGNGALLTVNAPIELGLLLPLPSSLKCCTRKATICIKFIFRDNNCTECVMRKCFEVVIK